MGTRSQVQACSSYNSTHYVQVSQLLILFLTSRYPVTAGSTEAIRGRESCSRTQHDGTWWGSKPLAVTSPTRYHWATTSPSKHVLKPQNYLINGPQSGFPRWNEVVWVEPVNHNVWRHNTLWRTVCVSSVQTTGSIRADDVFWRTYSRTL
jgi:hypothetical protein